MVLLCGECLDDLGSSLGVFWGCFGTQAFDTYQEKNMPSAYIGCWGLGIDIEYELVKGV